MRIVLLAALGVLACKDGRGTEPNVGGLDTPTVNPHGAGRNRWRGGGVYVDGAPVGVLRYAELPAGLEPIWETRRHRLPFKPGEEIRYSETKVPRFRVTDYLHAIGVRIEDVVQIHLHGGRQNAIVLKGEDLRLHPDEVLFKFAGDTSGKPVPIIRSIDVGTSFDDLGAMTIYIDRKPPVLTGRHTLELDGRPVLNIPYYGEPLREGVRIYVDDRLVTVLKRNQLPPGRASLTEILAKQGVAVGKLDRVQLIHDEARTATLAWSDLDFEFNPAASGEILIGKDDLRAHSIALYSRTRVTKR